MKKRYSTAIGMAVATLLILLVTGCSNAIQGVTKSGTSTGKTSVTLSLPTMSSGLAKVLNVAPATTGSRALMFLNSYSLSVYDQTAMSWEYSPTIAPVPDGPGGSQEYTLELVAGRTYDIYLYGTNTTENPYSTTVMGVAYDQYISSGSSISITLKPYSPLTLGNAAGSSFTQAVEKSVMEPDPVIAGKFNFTHIGGEKWYTVTPDSNVFQVEVAPTTGFVYAALFDSDGQFLTAGVSPSFGGGTTSTVVLESGVTAGSPVYLGLVDIVTGSPAAGYEKDDVTVTVNASSLADDDYDLNGNDTMTSAGRVSAPADGTPATVADLKAFDADYYYFYANSAGTYTVTVTDTDTAFPSGYFGTVSLSGPSGDSTDSSYGNGNEVTKSSFQTSLAVTGPGYYYVYVGLRSSDPKFDFPILAGTYDMVLSYAP